MSQIGDTHIVRLRTFESVNNSMIVELHEQLGSSNVGRTGPLSRFRYGRFASLRASSRILIALAIFVSMTNAACAQYNYYYDRRSQNELKLLEFVSPHYNGSMLHDVIVGGMSEQFNDDSDEMKKNKESIAKLYVSALRSEDQNRKLNTSANLLWLQQQGIRSNSLIRAQGANQKAIDLSTKDELARATLEHEKNQFEVQKGLREVKLAKRYDTIKSKLPDAVSSKSGSYLNTLFESLRPSLLRFGYTLPLDNEFKQYLDKLIIEDADFKNLQLTVSFEGPPIVFSAAEGSGALGKVPFNMRAPKIKTVLDQIEASFAKLAEMASDDASFFPTVQALPALLERLDEVSEEVIGTKYEAVVKEKAIGLEKWNAANDFRLSLRGIVNRLEIEGSPEILQSRLKYDPEQHGNKLLPFLTFIASNGCRFAPAKPGGENAYVRMHELLLKLQAIIED